MARIVASTVGASAFGMVSVKTVATNIASPTSFPGHYFVFFRHEIILISNYLKLSDYKLEIVRVYSVDFYYRCEFHAFDISRTSCLLMFVTQ